MPNLNAKAGINNNCSKKISKQNNHLGITTQNPFPWVHRPKVSTYVSNFANCKCENLLGKLQMRNLQNTDSAGTADGPPPVALFPAASSQQPATSSQVPATTCITKSSRARNESVTAINFYSCIGRTNCSWRRTTTMSTGQVTQQSVWVKDVAPDPRELGRKVKAWTCSGF